MRKNEIVRERALQPLRTTGRQRIVVVLALVGFLAGTLSVQATLRVSNAVTGNWGDTASWVGGVAPASTDTAEIVAGANITTAAAATIAGVKVDAGGTLTLSSVLTVNHGTSPDLDVFGLVNITGGSAALTLGANATVVVETGGQISHNGTASGF